MSWSTASGAVAVLLMLAGTGCASGTPVTRPTGTPAPQPSSAAPNASPPAARPTEVPTPVATVAWGSRLPATPLPDGWSMTSCPGDAPLYCVTGPDGAAGVVEYLTFPADSVPANLDAVAADAVEGAVADRQAGCPQGYTAEGEQPSPVTFAGADGLRWGFAVRDAGGAAVERSVTFAALRDGLLHLVVSEGLTEQACLAVEGPTFTPQELDAFVPLLAEIVAASSLSP